MAVLKQHSEKECSTLEQYKELCYIRAEEVALEQQEEKDCFIEELKEMIVELKEGDKIP